MIYNILKYSLIIVFLITLVNRPQMALAQSTLPDNAGKNVGFPDELVRFNTYEKNPVFAGTGTNTWDQMIRERGCILKEEGIYHMWYTGYTSHAGKDTESHLGYANSKDGLTWTRYKNNPISDSCMVEDMCVIKSNGIYYLFAEGRNDIAHLLTSVDRIHWKEHGPLDIRYKNGESLSKGPFGTPSVWLENNTWYLFYERDDLGIWLATSTDLKVWKNVQDEQVLKIGPEPYDNYAVAFDQIIKYKGSYYAYYHASGYRDWHEWTSCLARSEDLIHWQKYSGNPVLQENKSSPFLVFDGTTYRLYTMHPEICVHFQEKLVKQK